MKTATKTRRPFTSGDPFTLFFRRALNLKPLYIVLILVPLLNIPIVISTHINNAWFSPNFVGLFQDYSWWLLQVTSIAFGTFYFYWLPIGYQEIITGLLNNKVINNVTNDIDGIHSIDNFINKWETIYSSINWSLLSIGCSILFLIVVAIPEQSKYIIWQTTGQFVFWYTVIYWGYFFYICFLGIIRAAIILLSINRLFKVHPINIRVLHPDGAGGLSPLSDFSVKLGYLVGVFGIASVSINLSQSYISTNQYSGIIMTPYTIILLIAYLLFSPLLFFMPIGSARNIMKKAKNEMLLQISDQFAVDMDVAMSKLDSKTKELKADIEKIEQLQKIYSIAKNFPVWPFNVENLVRFFSSIFSPVLLGIISFLVNLIVK